MLGEAETCDGTLVRGEQRPVPRRRPGDRGHRDCAAGRNSRRELLARLNPGGHPECRQPKGSNPELRPVAHGVVIRPTKDSPFRDASLNVEAELDPFAVR